jgi:hypothetical protein
MKQLITIMFLLAAFSIVGSAQYYGGCPIECGNDSSCILCHLNAGTTVYYMTPWGITAQCTACGLPDGNPCVWDPMCFGGDAAQKKSKWLSAPPKEKLTFAAKMMLVVDQFLSPARTVQAADGKRLPAGHPQLSAKNQCQTRVIMASASRR